MYEQTHSAYGIGLHSIHRACIHCKSIISDSTSSNETCDPRLMHSYTTSFANPNVYLVSLKQIILLWAWQDFHCTTLSTLAKVNPYLQQHFPLPVSVHTCINRQQFSPAVEGKRMTNLTPNYFHYSRIIYAIFTTTYIT